MGGVENEPTLEQRMVHQIPPFQMNPPSVEKVSPI
jgi:hypothetical protein